jgi:hypothetical protein
MEHGDERQSGLHCGIRNWSRWEMLYDVSVVELGWLEPPYSHSPAFPIVRRAIWQVESEIARDASKVAEDFGKLRIGRAENKLFVAATTLQIDDQPWLRSFANATRGMDGPVYLALIPSYAADQRDKNHWRSRTANVLLYRCSPDGSYPQRYPWMRTLLANTNAAIRTALAV